MDRLLRNKVMAQFCKNFKRCSDNKIIPYDACSSSLYPLKNPYNGRVDVGLGIIWEINGINQGSNKLCRFYQIVTEGENIWLN